MRRSAGAGSCEIRVIWEGVLELDHVRAGMWDPGHMRRSVGAGSCERQVIWEGVLDWTAAGAGSCESRVIWGVLELWHNPAPAFLLICPRSHMTQLQHSFSYDPALTWPGSSTPSHMPQVSHDPAPALLFIWHGSHMTQSPAQVTISGGILTWPRLRLELTPTHTNVK